MEKEEISKNLNYLNNFIGYGDSNKAKVFHIAIEEKLDKNYIQEEIVNEFITKRDIGRTEILIPTTVHPGTEYIQSRLSYKLITEILRIDMGYTMDDYLRPDFEILRNLEFCSNENPIACTAEGEWADVNTLITGYVNRIDFLNDSWNGTGNFEGITPRRDVFSEFLMKIKARMENEKYFLLIEGNSPFDRLKELIESIFEIDTNSQEGRGILPSHLGREMYSYFGNKIWRIYHPGHNNFINTDIDNLLVYLRNNL